MKKRYFLIALLVFSTALSLPVLCEENKLLFNSKLKNFAAQQSFIDKGGIYLSKLDFDQAIAEYDKACDSKYLTQDIDKWWPNVHKVKAYFYSGQYQKALALNVWFLTPEHNQRIPKEVKAKIEALIVFQQTGKKQPVYDFIEQYKKANPYLFPPKQASAQALATLAELYDLIGDYDTGIALAEKFFKIAKSEGKKTRKEYDSLIQAFEESKRGMPKECSEDKKYCVGRATAYIIRSKYF